MKKLLLATTCLALTSTASMAADMGMPYTKAPVATSAFSWTGCYAGAHVGGGSLTTNGLSVVNTEGPGTNLNNTNANGSGAVAGGQLGCNYQDGNWVFGLEGEGYWSGIKSSQTVTFNGVNNSEGISMKNSNDFTIAARAGIALDRTFIYGKGGWAWGNYKLDANTTCCGNNPNIQTGSASGYLNGFMVGAGIEHALTHNWTIKAEYDYIGFGTKDFATTGCFNGECGPGSRTTSASSNTQLFKVGFNYLFGPGH